MKTPITQRRSSATSSAHGKNTRALQNKSGVFPILVGQDLGVTVNAGAVTSHKLANNFTPPMQPKHPEVLRLENHIASIPSSRRWIRESLQELLESFNPNLDTIDDV